MSRLLFPESLRGVRSSRFVSAAAENVTRALLSRASSASLAVVWARDPDWGEAFFLLDRCRFVGLSSFSFPLQPAPTEASLGAALTGGTRRVSAGVAPVEAGTPFGEEASPEYLLALLPLLPEPFPLPPLLLPLPLPALLHEPRPTLFWEPRGGEPSLSFADGFGF